MNNIAHSQLMKKKRALILFTIFDLLGIVVLWIGYHSLKNYFLEINLEAEVIEFSSRSGFFSAGVLVLMAHLLGIIEYFYPKIIKQHMKAFNLGTIVALFMVLFSGFYISSWMKYNVENFGYVYCRNASGVSALERTLVYTKNMETCEELVASKRKR
jgi:hypothetical protein